MCKIIAGLVIGISIFSACDGPYYKVVVEEVVPAEETWCQGYCEEVYNPNLVDPYSEDTNWYIDETGKIIWRR